MRTEEDGRSPALDRGTDLAQTSRQVGSSRPGPFPGRTVVKTGRSPPAVQGRGPRRDHYDTFDVPWVSQPGPGGLGYGDPPMPATSPWLWIGFNLFLLLFLALDLGVFHRKSHEVSIREASVWSAVWIGLALLFNLGIYWLRGPEPALEFLTGYLIEKSLSVDNIFVFALIFGYFAVPAVYQHRVLFWGILGALVLRAALILVGAALIHEFHWIIWVFGVFLIFT